MWREHWQMYWGDVQLKKDADGTGYLHFSERQTKTRKGADPRNVRPIKPKAFATPDLPHERDPVVVFKIYSETKPESINKPDTLFIWVSTILQKTLIKVGLQPVQWELTNLTV